MKRRKKIRVYLCGPMTGYPQKNYPAFYMWAKRLRAVGYTVVSPEELNTLRTPEKLAMQRDIAALAMCDMLAYMPGHRTSVGAWKEKIVADLLDIPMMEVENAIMIGMRRS